jgi:hypothetical protein
VGRAYEAGFQPAMVLLAYEPRALPWAGMNDAVGVGIRQRTSTSAMSYARHKVCAASVHRECANLDANGGWRDSRSVER